MALAGGVPTGCKPFRVPSQSLEGHARFSQSVFQMVFFGPEHTVTRTRYIFIYLIYKRLI
jgi:hypothetical protein